MGDWKEETMHTSRLAYRVSFKSYVPGGGVFTTSTAKSVVLAWPYLAGRSDLGRG